MTTAPQRQSGTVIVSDGDQRAALAVVRSLGRAGWRVVVVGPRRRVLAGASRYCDRYVRVPAAADSASGFVSALEELVRVEPPELMLPIVEASLFVLSASRERFGIVLDWLPPDASVRVIHDKEAVLDAAARAGLSVPPTEIVTDPAQLAAAARLRFPLAVRSHRSLAPDGADRLRKVPVRYAADPAELARIASESPRAAFPLLVQSRLTGAGIGVFLLRWQGRLRAAFMHRRIREKPPAGGVSVLRESIPLRPDLVARCADLLHGLDWSGVAMIEFKEDVPGGEPQVLEINGRFWGSLQLAIDAGVDFPLLLARLARGENGFSQPEYRSGVRLRWEWGEVDHVLARRSLGALGNLFSWRPGDRNEVFRWSDPLPFARETLDWFLRR